MIKLLLFLWQFPQIVLGEIVLVWSSIFLRKRYAGYRRFSWSKHKYVNVTVVFFHSKEKNSIKAYSLGRRIFVFYDNTYPNNAVIEQRKTEVSVHEYGHSIYSAYLGWLYLFVIAIPSLIVTGISPNIAERCYFEVWANDAVKELNKEN